MALIRRMVCWLMVLLMGLVLIQAKAGTFCQKDIYIIIYATSNGNTGHAAIAIDRYMVKIVDCATCKGKVSYDTSSTGELAYYDLWPLHDDFQKSKMYENDLALYHHLPASSSEPVLTVKGIIQKGIGQINLGPCDALLKIPNSAFQDFKLKSFLEKAIDQQIPFNLWEHNCADFVEKAIEYSLKINVDADELILFDKATTPNSLYKALRKIPGVVVMKDPGNLINGSFLQERILKRPKN